MSAQGCVMSAEGCTMSARGWIKSAEGCIISAEGRIMRAQGCTMSEQTLSPAFGKSPLSPDSGPPEARKAIRRGQACQKVV